METPFPSPTHQLGGDVLGKAHRRDAVRADHQQRDDDVDEGQPVGEVGPAGRGLRSAEPDSQPDPQARNIQLLTALTCSQPSAIFLDSSFTTAILNTHLYAFLSQLKPSQWFLAALRIKSNAAHSHWLPGLAALVHLPGLLPLLLQFWECNPCPTAAGPLHMTRPLPEMLCPSLHPANRCSS